MSSTAKQRLEDGRKWGSALLRQRAALDRAGIVVDYVRVRGTQIRIGRKEGEGRPLLICNGIGANFEMLAPFVEAVADRPVILFDVPGTGGSENAWLVPPWMRNYSRYVQRVLDHCEVDDVDVAGISWGGLLAQRLAFDAPGRVRHLILMATSTGIFMVPGRWSALRLMFTPRRYLTRSFMVQHAHTLYGHELLEEGRAVEHAAMARAPSALSYVQQLAAAQYFTSLPWLWRIRCPTLVLVGDDDPLMRVVNSRMLARFLPNAELKIIEGGGHLFGVVRPELTARLVSDFLGSNS